MRVTLQIFSGMILPVMAQEFSACLIKKMLEIRKRILLQGIKIPEKQERSYISCISFCGWKIFPLHEAIKPIIHSQCDAPSGVAQITVRTMESAILPGKNGVSTPGRGTRCYPVDNVFHSGLQFSVKILLGQDVMNYR